mgnify:CR=1 FL=1
MDLYLKLYLHILKNLKLIIFASLLSGIFFTISSYYFEEKYVSSSNLKVSETTISSMQSLTSGYQSIGGLVGLNFPGSEIQAKIDLVVETLKSRDFLKQLILEHQEVAPNIYAIESYDLSSDNLKYQKDIFDKATGKWIINEDKGIRSDGPQFYKIYNKFHGEIFNVYVNPSNNFISLRVEHYSPVYAQDLLTKIIDSLNSLLRDKDLNKAEQAIFFLQEQVQIANQKEIKESLYSIIERNLETLMLTNINSYYAIEPVDLPNIPERKIFPNRKVFLLLGVFFGFFFSTAISLIVRLNK